jgi:hypothetical protein
MYLAVQSERCCELEGLADEGQGAVGEGHGTGVNYPRLNRELFHVTQFRPDVMSTWYNSEQNDSRKMSE